MFGSVRKLARLLAGAWLLVAGGPAAAADLTRLDIQAPDADGAYGYHASFAVDAPAAALRDVYLNVCGSRRERSPITACQVIDRQGASYWTYMMAEFPAFKPRDYVLQRTVVQDLEATGQTVFRAQWRQDHARGPPARPGIIRVPVDEGTLTITPSTDGRRCTVDITGRLAPGGKAPPLLVESVARAAAPRAMDGMEERAQELAHSTNSMRSVEVTLSGLAVKPLAPPWPRPVRASTGSLAN